MTETREFTDSTQIEKMEYDHENERLKVWFINGSKYMYMDVPESIWQGCKKANSIGSYHYGYIRNNFPFEKIK